MTENKVDENVKAEENEAKHVKDEGGIASDIVEGVKENWWKILLGATATIGALLLGYELGSKPTTETAGDVEGEEPPFDTDEADI